METTNTLTIKVDLNAPTTTATLTPPIAERVVRVPTLTLPATTAGSGIAKIEYSLDGGPWQQYTVRSRASRPGITSSSTGRPTTSAASRTTKLLAFKVDAEKPTVNISTPPAGATYKKDKVVKAKYKCTDTESGIDSCVGTVPNGANLDTSTVGDHTFTVTGTDKAGNVTVVTRTYHVHYAWNGFFAPVTNARRAAEPRPRGRPDPAEVRLGGDQGLNVFAGGSPGSTPVSCPAWTPHSVPAAPAGSTTGLSFAPSKYRYGWQTSTAWAGTCRTFSLQLNDGTGPHTATFMFFS